MTIDKPRSTAQLHALWKQAFGDTEAYIQSFFTFGFHPDRCLCAYHGEQLAATLYWFDCRCGERRFAYLYAVATDSRFQGQGICRTLMAHTHRHLQALGYAGAILVPGSKALFGMYEKFGYRRFGGINKFFCTAAQLPFSVRVITPEEYAKLRRQLLPAGGVVQEEACLSFLHTQAEFYAGEGVVFCAAREDDALIVPELLGDPSVAPGIVKALGYETGHFRTPGKEYPFAMYLPFDGSTPVPAYFGIALD